MRIRERTALLLWFIIFVFVGSIVVERGVQNSTIELEIHITTEQKAEEQVIY